MDYTVRIKKILDQISIALNEYIKKDEDPGLLTGSCGCALFYAYYYKLTGKKKYLNLVHQIIEKMIRALAGQELNYSHCSGIAGIMWCLQHLVNSGFAEQDESGNAFEEVDDLLFKVMKLHFEVEQYDFLHEGLGIALYFLEKMPDAAAQKYLEEAVVQLEKLSVHTDTGITWRDHFTAKNKSDDQLPVYNLGLAHGVPSILSVLCMMYEKGIVPDKTLPLMEKGVSWLLASKNKPGDHCVSLYPTSVTADNQAVGEKLSRLGWCYGDLSIAIPLLNIGNRLQNDTCKQEAYTIFNHTLQHRNKENGSIVDASLCHGSMGVSHIFRRAYLESGDDLYLKGSAYWLDQTIQMADWEDGLAGFKYYLHNGFTNNYNLLEGITGIGLALITTLDPGIKPAWDRCLLIS